MLVSRKRTYQNLDDIADLLIRIGADIVALQEADAPSRWSGKFDHVEYLLEKTDYACFVHGHHAQSWLYNFGSALLSDVQLVDTDSQSFAPSPPTTTKGYVSSVINWQTTVATVPLLVVSVHLDFSRRRVRDAQVNAMIRSLSGHNMPMIVMGDMNSEWSNKESVVKLLADGLALKAYEPGEEGQGTYKSSSGKRLDWILISPQLAFIEHSVLPDVISDHNAVYAEIGYLGVR